MKKIMLLTLGLAVNICLANFEQIQQSYQGQNSDRDKVDLIIKPIEVRPGSYLGVLIFNEQMKVYMVDEINDVNYSLTPFTVSDDLYAQIVNPNPSYRIVFSGRDQFRLTAVEGGNASGVINGLVGASFTMKDTDMRMIAMKDGEFQQVNVARRSAATMNFSPMDTRSKSASVALVNGDVITEFSLFSQFDHLHLMQTKQFSASGSHIAENSQYLAIFIESSGHGLFNNRSRVFAYLMDAQSNKTLQFQMQ